MIMLSPFCYLESSFLCFFLPSIFLRPFLFLFFSILILFLLLFSLSLFSLC